MSGLAIFNDVVKPIGAIVSIIIIVLLFGSLTHDFIGYSRYKKTRTNKLQIAALITFITYILYNTALVLGRWAFDVKACSVRVPMLSCLWAVTRAALYLFLLIRVEMSFVGSSYASKPIFIKAFGALIIVVYAVRFSTSIYNRDAIQFDETNRICVPKGTMKRIAQNLLYTYAFLLVDFLIGVVICGLFARKLWKLQQSINTHLVDVVLDENDTDKQANFINVAKKQTKLAFVAYITSLLALYIMPATKYFSLPFLDALINALCVYCTFSFDVSSKVHWYLCECGGDKRCLCVFCFCCWCCNLPPKKGKEDRDGTQTEPQTIDRTTNTVDTTVATTRTADSMPSTSTVTITATASS